jgi:hypothetical protein
VGKSEIERKTSLCSFGQKLAETLGKAALQNLTQNLTELWAALIACKHRELKRWRIET